MKEIIIGTIILVLMYVALYKIMAFVINIMFDRRNESRIIRLSQQERSNRVFSLRIHEAALRINELESNVEYLKRRLSI